MSTSATGKKFIVIAPAATNDRRKKLNERRATAKPSREEVAEMRRKMKEEDDDEDEDEDEDEGGEQKNESEANNKKKKNESEGSPRGRVTAKESEEKREELLAKATELRAKGQELRAKGLEIKSQMRRRLERLSSLQQRSMERGRRLTIDAYQVLIINIYH
jgi:cobalamin biosynthesis protein CobT